MTRPFSQYFVYNVTSPNNLRNLTRASLCADYLLISRLFAERISISSLLAAENIAILRLLLRALRIYVCFYPREHAAPYSRISENKHSLLHTH